MSSGIWPSSTRITACFVGQQDWDQLCKDCKENGHEETEKQHVDASDWQPWKTPRGDKHERAASFCLWAAEYGCKWLILNLQPRVSAHIQRARGHVTRQRFSCVCLVSVPSCPSQEPAAVEKPEVSGEKVFSQTTKMLLQRYRQTSCWLKLA